MRYVGGLTVPGLPAAEAWRQIHDEIEGPDLIGKRCWPGAFDLAGDCRPGQGPTDPGNVVAIRQLDWMRGLGINSQRVQRPQAPPLSFYISCTQSLRLLRPARPDQAGNARPAFMVCES